MEYAIQDVKKIVGDCYERFADGEAGLNEAADTIRFLLSWPEGIPFADGLRRLGAGGFSEEEMLCTMLFLDDFLWNGVIPLQYTRFCRHKDYGSILRGIEDLLSRGVIRFGGSPSDQPEKNSERKNRYYMTNRTLGLLFKGAAGHVPYGEIARHAEIIPAASIRPRELFFSGKTFREVERMSRILQPDRLPQLFTRLEEGGRHAAATFLLYGPPGTGKTELARQLARSTGRDVIMADISKLTSSFHGDTEKNYTDMFNAYRNLNSLSAVTPILLLNEADAFLCKRGDVFRQAIDKIEHRIQNILLQQLEDFDGILIATTNLADNLDPAFGRRFLFRIEMEIPGREARARIWRNAMPSLNAREAQDLAAAYSFSGAQIDNVAAKCGIESVLLERDLTLAEIRSFCEGEQVAEDASQKAAPFMEQAGRGSGILS